eukprot:1204214-Pyramimonas_sp.AAC.1
MQAASQSPGGAGGAGNFGGGVHAKVIGLIGAPIRAMSSLTARIWMNALLLICMMFTITMSSAGSILVAMTMHTSTSSSATLFKVDTGLKTCLLYTSDAADDTPC